MLSYFQRREKANPTTAPARGIEENEMNAKKGYRIIRDNAGYRMHCWYDLGTGKVWDGLPSYFATRKAAEAAGKRRGK
jgi:hypothetical protein